MRTEQVGLLNLFNNLNVLTSLLLLQSLIAVPGMVSAEHPLCTVEIALSATADSRRYLQQEVGKTQYLRQNAFVNIYRPSWLVGTQERREMCCSLKQTSQKAPSKSETGFATSEDLYGT